MPEQSTLSAWTVPTRRRLVAGVGLLLAGRSIVAAADAAPVEIRMLSDEEGAHVGFDPVGVLLRPGQTVRWTCAANYHTTTAYHPANGNHSLRIPRGAQPWASDVLSPDESFAVTLTVEGVYDYFCAPHEQAGMVGRLIVGRPEGPGALPFDWFEGRTEGRVWLEVPEAARRVFPAVAEIMWRKRVPAQRMAAASAGRDDHMPVCRAG
jgi:plastocyanin